MWFMLRLPERFSTYRPHEFPAIANCLWEDFCMVGGKNPDGIGHYVVGYRGIPCWDPNPRRRGLVSYNELSWLIAPPQAAVLKIEFTWRGFEMKYDTRAQVIHHDR